MLSFLIDECCSPDLVAESLAAGHRATHVNYLGLSGRPDRDLIPFILAGDYVFVNNNRRDFVRLYADLELHAGLLVILPSVSTAKQLELFVTATAFIATKGIDMINLLVEIDADGRIRSTPWPVAAKVLLPPLDGE